MKRISFLLAAVFLLAFVSPLTLQPSQAASLEPLQQPEDGQPEAAFNIRQVFRGWGGFFVALALIWLVMSAIMAARDVYIIKKTHGAGLEQSKKR
jgi:uncharacterized membrane protein